MTTMTTAKTMTLMARLRLPLKQFGTLNSMSIHFRSYLKSSSFKKFKRHVENRLLTRGNYLIRIRTFVIKMRVREVTLSKSFWLKMLSRLSKLTGSLLRYPLISSCKI